MEGSTSKEVILQQNTMMNIRNHHIYAFTGKELVISAKKLIKKM